MANWSTCNLPTVGRLPQRGDIVLMPCLFSASILRHVYLRNGLGIGHLTRVYGGMEYNSDSDVCIKLTDGLCSTEEVEENSEVT